MFGKNLYEFTKFPSVLVLNLHSPGERDSEKTDIQLLSVTSASEMRLLSERLCCQMSWLCSFPPSCRCHACRCRRRRRRCNQDSLIIVQWIAHTQCVYIISQLFQSLNIYANLPVVTFQMTRCIGQHTTTKSHICFSTQFETDQRRKGKRERREESDTQDECRFRYLCFGNYYYRNKILKQHIDMNGTRTCQRMSTHTHDLSSTHNIFRV